MDKKLPIFAANWKMYKTTEDAKLFISTLLPLIVTKNVRVLIAPPYTAISTAVQAAVGSSFVIGAQNMSEQQEGAYTGEISSRMLKEVGAQFVILGHSERRVLFHETNQVINKKIKSAVTKGLIPILCIGESLAERAQGDTYKVLTHQLESCLEGFTSFELSSLIVAYEPVWAIGSGKTPTPQDVQEIHQYCRQLVEDKFGTEFGISLSILYGGSVKPEVVSHFMELSDVDGVLVGGASLDPYTFAKIIQTPYVKN